MTRDSPQAGPGPLTQSAAPSPRRMGARAASSTGEGGGNKRGGDPIVPQTANR